MTGLRPRLVALGLLVLLVPVVLAGYAAADVVKLRGGTRLEGVVLEQGEQGVLLLLPEGSEVRLAAGDVAEVERDAAAPTTERFIRYVEDERGGRLQSAVVHLVGPNGRRVDLIGALHIADRSFFRAVQALLERADVVLYEVVKAKDVTVEELRTSTNPIREFQVKLATAMDLVFQMDEIDYGRPHFVHADLTPEEMGLTAVPSGVQGMISLVGAFLDTMARSSEQRADLKRQMARMLGNFGPRAAKLLGGGSDVLIGRRNAVVVERLAELPVEAKRVAVFYGGGHLPDLEERLAAVGYRRAGARWLDAWAVPPKAPAKPEKTAEAAEPVAPR